ncbi:hypothetical protein IMF27_29850 [Pseudomonas sp. PCH199]|uniref:hypothetical protein n=1 Tax=unclassified Pseudomonas TaxID=196821 RepID=UPI000BC703CF|nr:MULTISPECIES: hypothetical protein [unclassified Pseudomonas]MCW8279163.1 hypothetical protein [Pseudomonas sp. PCH199]PAM78569.1 hypothetical protein CES87_30550 [Pseudomonas sp. ERMR1:02]
MNRCVTGLIMLALSGILGQLAQAQNLSPHVPLNLAQNLPNSGNNNPYNSPIRRANPNSMQGTQPGAPVFLGPNTVPVPRPPTLDNGGIGNRYPQERSAPASQPKFLPNPPQRDADTSNR